MSEKRDESVKVLGWERAVLREGQPFKERWALTSREGFAILPVLLFFGLLFGLACFLAGNPFESTTRIGSAAVQKLGWAAGSDSWGIIGMVLILCIIFEFLDSAAGMGYGTTFTPLLLLMGYDPMQIVPIIMIQQAAAGLSSSYLHRELGNIEWKFNPPSASVRLWLIIALTGSAAVVFSITSVYALLKPAVFWIKLYVCLLLFAMGIISLVGRGKSVEFRPRRMAFFGALAGFNKGIGGGGYGPVVTIGGLLSGIPVKSMTAITALSEGTVCVVSIVTWFMLLGQGVVIDFVLLPTMVLGSVISVLLAPYAVRVMPEGILKFFLPSYCLIIGGLSFWKLMPEILTLF
ncbi:MAG: sulfite exporter TauE/SafE family protein [Spirochaetales bacterium]|nr:sulfite exporter TauE/SafE family protein [Spirochaetales bacterium]